MTYLEEERQKSVPYATHLWNFDQSETENIFLQPSITSKDVTKDILEPYQTQSPMTWELLNSATETMNQMQKSLPATTATVTSKTLARTMNYQPMVVSHKRMRLQSAPTKTRRLLSDAELDDELFGCEIVYPTENLFTNAMNFKSGSNRLKVAIQEREIYNETKFQHYLRNDSEFCKLVANCYASNLEVIKKQMFQVVRETKSEKTYANAMAHINITEDDEFFIAASTALEIAHSIAYENRVELPDFLTSLFLILNKTLFKKNTIVFIGASDSGKTYFAEVLLSPFEHYEIGWFNLPPTRNVNQFWMEGLLGADIYRAEEVFVANEESIQDLKKLFEGNPALEAAQKYKSPVCVPRRPVIVTMNGESENDLTKGISKERKTMNNRAFIYKMNKPLKERFTEGCLTILKKRAPEVCKKLWLKYGQEELHILNNNIVDFCKEKFNTLF